MSKAQSSERTDSPPEPLHSLMLVSRVIDVSDMCDGRRERVSREGVRNRSAPQLGSVGSASRGSGASALPSTAGSTATRARGMGAEVKLCVANELAAAAETGRVDAAAPSA